MFTRDLANGWSETAQYHPRGWCLAKITYATDAPEHARVRKYEYSGEGDLQRVIDSEKGLTQHHHDAAHRLAATLHPDGRQDTYRYTKSGSLLEKPGLREGTVGHLNQLRYADGHRFEYGVRQHVERHTTPDGRTFRYHYDARDQLVAVSVDGEVYFRAEYDAIGRRIEKTVQGETTRYYWDTDRLAAEVLPDGRLRVYVYPDAFSMVPMMFVDYESEDADPASGTRYYLFCDQRGCPERVVDDLGVVVWEAYVEPYGTAHITVGADFYQPLRFPGHWWDAELGLHYNRFRYYSPWLGRYLQVDPTGEEGGLNVYAYGAGPLVQVDVDGLTASRGRKNCGGGGGQSSEGRPERRAGDRGDSEGQAESTTRGSARRKRGDHVFANGLRGAVRELRVDAESLPRAAAARVRRAADRLDQLLDHRAFDMTTDTGFVPERGDPHSRRFGEACDERRSADEDFHDAILDRETAPEESRAEAHRRLSRASDDAKRAWSELFNNAEDRQATERLPPQERRMAQGGRQRLGEMSDEIASMLSNIVTMYSGPS